jgi:hypothetical protein
MSAECNNLAMSAECNNLAMSAECNNLAMSAECNNLAMLDNHCVLNTKLLQVCCLFCLKMLVVIYERHQNPGQGQLNPFWPVRTHLKCHTHGSV